jgi:hypothetical protein
MATSMNNPVVSYALLHPTSAQEVPTNYFIAPMQHHMIPRIHNCPSEDYASQQSQRMTTTSEEEETQNNSKNEWQVIGRTKRKKYTEHNTPETKIETHNRYGLLTNETNEEPLTEIQVQRKSINLLQYSYCTWCYKLRRYDKANKRHSQR